VRLSFQALAAASSLLLLMGAAPHGREAGAQPAALKARRAAAAVEPPAPPPEPPEPSRDIPRGLSRLRSFGDADGLHNLVVVSIIQDHRGALWLGTDEGVYRYDGERFTLFGLQDGLLSTTTQVLGIGPSGEICSGSKRGMVCWNGTGFSAEGAEGIPEGTVYTIASHRDQMWVGTESGLYRRGKAGPFTRAPGWPVTVRGPVDSLWVDDHGVVTGVNGAVWIKEGDGPWRSPTDIGLTGDRIDGILRDAQGATWIRTAVHLWHLPRGASHATDLAPGLPPANDTYDIAVNMINGSDGKVWVGTDDGVAYRQDDHWRVLGSREGFPGVRTLFIDREGTAWFGANGLYRWRGRGLLERFDDTNGLPGKAAWSFGRDRQGTMWIGTDQCLSRMLDGQWRCLPGTENHFVRGFVFPPQGGVFLGGLPADLVYVDPAGVSTKLSPELSASRAQRILDLELGPEGDLWVGTRLGLYRMRGAVPGPLERVVIPGVSERAGFATLLVDGPRLWAPSTEGLVLIDGATIRVFTTNDGFRVNPMRYMTARRDGHLCVAYAEAIGASCFRWDGRRISVDRHYDTSSGLTSAKVYFLGEDRWQRLWVGTGDGVDVLTEHGARPGAEHFTERDGLAGNDSAANAFFSDLDGSLWLGAVGGATRVSAAAYQGPPPPPRAIIRGGKLGEGSIHPHLPGHLETTHEQSSFTLDFGSDSLNDPDRIEVQVRMQPFEQEWSAGATARQARYPSLLPGTYRSQVRARVDQGAWSEPAELSFVVLPAWWQTHWFLGLAIALGLAAIGGLFSWRQRAALRQRTRQLDAQASARLRDLLDAVPDLIFVHRGLQIIYLNRAARTMFGVEVSAGVTDKVRARVHPGDIPGLRRLAAQARDFDPSATPGVMEARIHAADDSWRTIEISCVRMEFGGTPAVVTVGRDVSERLRLRAKLVVSDRMASLGTLAAGIAHEINNPLTYVIGNLELVAEAVGATDDEDLAGALADAADGAERVRKIVNGLRSFSRSEEEKRVAIDVRSSLQAAIRLTANEVRHRARMVSELGEVPQVVADDGKLTQVFINLIVNAAHAIAAGKSDEHRITARSFTDGDGRAVVEISDTGSGMPPEVLARVFDPFFTTKDVGEGTGLGLSICHGIIEGLGGQISIDSTPGQGTTVRVAIPGVVAAPVEAPTAQSAEPAARAARHRVMVIDDEPLVAEMLCRTLRRDHEITVESCGKDALERIAGGARFDAIVSDVMMPNMTGLELLEELLVMAPDQARKIIFLSGGVFSAQTRKRLDELGAPQLAKPVDTAELRSCIQRIAEDDDAALRGANAAAKLREEPALPALRA
jgi:PAS domain S-box-containing protein